MVSKLVKKCSIGEISHCMLHDKLEHKLQQHCLQPVSQNGAYPNSSLCIRLEHKLRQNCLQPVSQSGVYPNSSLCISTFSNLLLKHNSEITDCRNLATALLLIVVMFLLL